MAPSRRFAVSAGMRQIVEDRDVAGGGHLGAFGRCGHRTVRGTGRTRRSCVLGGVGAAHDWSVISRYSVYSANQLISTTAATSMISKNRTTRSTSLVSGQARAGQAILTSTSWIPAPFGSTMASPLPAARQRPQRPGSGCGEEPEVAGGRRDDLGGELAGGVQQPHERTADGLAGAIHYASGDDRFFLQVNAGGQGLSLLRRRAHISFPTRSGLPPGSRIPSNCRRSS